MLVGIVELDLMLYSVGSLKEKRQVVKSLMARLASRFNISIAEVENLDMWNKASIGLALVANDRGFIDSSISKILNFIDNDDRLEIINKNIEII